jgi:hypothetical protein
MSAEGTASQLEEVIRIRKEGLIMEDNIVDFVYQDLLREPVAAVARIYRHFGMSFGDAVERLVQSHFSARARGRSGKQRYDLGSPEQIARDRPHFQRYQQHYGVPSEV